MLKKSLRLGRKEFSTVFKKGRAFHFPYFIIKYKPHHKTPSPRFGVSCGLRVSKKATVRNCVRRRLFEAIHLSYDAFPSGDYVVIVRPGMAGKSFSFILHEVTLALAPLRKKYTTRGH